MRPLTFLAAAAALSAATTALAHSPYLMPNQFDVTQRDHVSVQASFTEQFFIPDIVMRAPGYYVLRPDGMKAAIAPIYSQDVAILDIETKTAGTYLISSGLREGSTRKAVQVNGQWEIIESGAAPANAVDMQAITRADVYVSRGTPTDAVLKPTGKALELQALVNPNKLHEGGKAQFVVLYDGKPLPNHLVEWHTGRDAARNAPAPAEFRSDAKGVVELPLQKAGLYVVMTRHRMGPAAPGRAGLSYTTTVTLEVTE